MIKNTGQKKISETMVTKPDITKRQEQLLEELNKCDDELSGQELHRQLIDCLLYTSPSPRDVRSSRMPSSA